MTFTTDHNTNKSLVPGATVKSIDCALQVLSLQQIHNNYKAVQQIQNVSTCPGVVDLL